MVDVAQSDAFEACTEEDVTGTTDVVRERLTIKVLSSIVSSFSEIIQASEGGLSSATLPLSVASLTIEDPPAEASSEGASSSTMPHAAAASTTVDPPTASKGSSALTMTLRSRHRK